MKPETLLEHFDVIADAPNGVQRLRELILRLGIRGLLVPQNPDEDAATVLLETLKAQHANVSRKGASRQAASSLHPEEQPYLLPPGWLWTRLSTVGAIVGGGTPPTHVEVNWAEPGVPWLTPADLNGLRGKYVYKGRRDISAAGLEHSSAQLLPAGTVLLSSRAPIGYVAIAGNPLATNQGFKSCVPFIPGMSEYIYRFLQAVAPDLDRNASGTTFREISGKSVGGLLFPLPPLDEQARIIAKIDRLMLMCDELDRHKKGASAKQSQLNRAAMHQLGSVRSSCATAPSVKPPGVIQSLDLVVATPESVSGLRMAITQLAIMGKLIPQSDEDGTADQLLLEVSNEKKKLCAESVIRAPSAPAPLTADIPFAIPDTWKWVRLHEIVAAITDGDHQPPPLAPSGVPFLVIGNVRTGALDFSRTRFVPQVYYDRLAPIRKPASGDLLYTVTGSYGIPILVQDSRIFCVQRHIAILKTLKCMDSEYLHLLLRSSLVADQAKNRATGIAQKTVSLEALRSFVVPVPPRKEQRRIVDRVSDLMLLCDRCEDKLVSAGEHADAVARAALLQYAVPIVSGGHRWGISV
ncbi:restriction endonuclease subunit S [Longimicrobium terrae]|uniref:Type I restriction enzyme S subunit n=1 Tax=Longimicrobium terrae TaxID=1639882 RepID=A0A841GYW1_9BACT|nr:restriction endonuclease subunit S [Longimicrobium terrae]MBB4636568.1 type I restriction enzyme S subunit [Longimicrobium terrae]MBB6070908.1 type I restriction enzyme S subunit [Longimicrobium terrae]NNC28931.1 restriction endonuclease [Longimicrobium terrae]